MSIIKSQEITNRLQEIQTIAAQLPQGGDIAKLNTELTKLANWINQTWQSLGRTEDKPCRCCPSECD